MRLIETLEAIRPDDYPQGSSVAIGKFDGLHLGHRAILHSLTQDARAAGRPAVVLTFVNNPLSLLRPERCPRPLMSREQRLEALAEAGVDDCVMIEFDEAVASIPAPDFVRDVLVGRLRAKHIIMGANFRFGHGGAGDHELLRELGERYGFSPLALQLVAADGTGEVSSSRVRDALAVGDVDTATRLLGRAPAVRGEVVHGDARGREIGFPTANLGGEIEGFVPADGVYAGWVLLGEGNGAPRPAAISVGNNPTFTPDAQPRVEAFLLDFSGDLYGQRMEVRFAHRLRGMERYDSLDALLEQMHADVARSRELLAP